MKGNDFEKLLVQINESIGVLGDKVEKVIIENKLIPLFHYSFSGT